MGLPEMRGFVPCRLPSPTGEGRQHDGSEDDHAWVRACGSLGVSRYRLRYSPTRKRARTWHGPTPTTRVRVERGPGEQRSVGIRIRSVGGLFSRLFRRVFVLCAV